VKIILKWMLQVEVLKIWTGPNCYQIVVSVVGFCGHGDEISGSIKAENSLIS
jgi:hypothetical protein